MKTPEEQLEFFRTKLGKLQMRQKVEQFSADLARSNLNVMSGALLAAEAFVKRTQRPSKDARDAVLRNYEIAAAAIAQLFPVFFVFESAWRTFAATRLDLVYGKAGWWHGVRDQVAQGADLGVARLGALPARGQVVRELGHILGTATRPSDLETTFELLEGATLKSLEVLIDLHWTDMAHPFTETMSLGKPTSAEFTELFKLVRQARNDASITGS